MSRGKRRANGEGSVYQRKDGRWGAAVYVPQPDGSIRRKQVYGRTAEEAREKRDDLARKARHGTPVPTRSRTTADYLTYWLREVASQKVRPTTLTSYEKYVNLYLIPGLGGKRLDRLQARDVRRFLNRLRDMCQCCAQGQDAKRPDNKRRYCATCPPRCCRKVPSGRTIQYVHAILRSALQHAVREDELDRNVARNVQVGSGNRPEIEPLSLQEARTLMRVASADRLHALWVLALMLGLRRGELLGLRWVDIDLEEGVLTVRQTLNRAQGQLYFDVPKTPRSRRRLPLPDRCLTALREHADRQDRQRQATGEHWHASELVFTTAVGTPIEPRNLNRTFNALLARAGVRRVRLHDLRHTTATLLRTEGVDLRLVMSILGHSALAVTSDTYTHVDLSAQREALGQLGRSMGDEH